MADQLERNTRAPNPDVETDDPLAELARIIGYERPEGKGAASAVSREAEESDFDLESELMRELDVLPLDGFDEYDEGEVPQPDLASEPAEVERGVSAENPPLDDDAFEFDSSWLENKPDEAVDAVADVPADVSGFDVDADMALPETQATAAEFENDVDLDLEDWESAEAGAGWEAESAGPAPFAAASAVDQAPEEIASTEDFSTADVPDDDVLADIFKYELPNHDAGSQSAPVVGEKTAGDEVQAEQASLVDEPVSSASVATAAETVDWPADEAEPGFGADTTDVNGSWNEESSAAIDFEDYLSAELDVFEHQVAMDASDQVPPAPAEIPLQQSVHELAPAAPEPVETDKVITGETVAAVEADMQPEVTYSLEDDFLFDEAAEDLLADFAQDEAIARAGLEDELLDDRLEAGVSEEMSEELEDLFVAPEPEPVHASANVEADGELEFDLEQVLAETVIEPAAGEVEALTDLSEPDEMAEAFKDLMIDQSPANPSDFAASDYRDLQSDVEVIHDDDTGDGDWLSGFEAEPAPQAQTVSGTASDDGFYFDADMITEPDETVEAVADIDVPDLPDDEPQAVVRDFDNDIERDFADMLEPEIAPADERTTLASAGGFGTASVADSEWGRDDNAAGDQQNYDDYAALERELTERDIQVSPPYGDTRSVLQQPAALDGEYASGLHGAEATEQSGSRGPVVALAVLGLAVLAGVGAFGWSMMSGGEGAGDEGPRIIRADKEPVKVLPENPGGATVPNQDKAVYDRVAGADDAQSGQPTLVNTAEEPVDVVQRTLDPSVLPLEGRDDLPNVKSEERLTAQDGSEVGPGAGAGTPVVSPRRVRTMVVRPDGSIVAREDPEPEVAQATVETAPQPLETDSAPVEVAPETEAAAEAVQTPVANADVADTSTQAQPAAEGTVAPVRVVTTQPIRAPVPQGRPADQPVNVVGTVTQAGNVAAQTPAAPAAPAQPVEVASAATAPVANPGGFYVQIASQPTAEGAQASWQTLSNRYSSVLGGRSVDIQRADIPGKGVFHRVRIPAGERSEANALCERYKAAGGSCFVSR